MSKSISILVCLITILSFGGITPVQTVCKVKLKNGDEVEGFMSIYNFNSFNYFEKGFLTTYKDYERKYFFSLDFVGFEIEEKEFGRNYLYGKGEDEAGYILEELYFIEYEIENKNNLRTYKSDIDTENKRLTQREEIVKNYRILDTIEIFQELPKHQNLMNLDEKVKSRKIATKDIRSFRFDKNPSEKWRKKIIKINSFLGSRIWWNHEFHNKDKEGQKGIRRVIRKKLKK